MLVFLVLWNFMILNEIIMYFVREENILIGRFEISDFEKMIVVLGVYFNSFDLI